LIFGLGTDIIHVPRVEKELVRTEGLKETLFTAREIAYCESRGKRAQHFAARFAAKEAFLKAMGTGWRDGYRFNEIEILNDESGKPEAFVHGKVKKYCDEKGITRVHVSLSHTQELAEAVVILEIISSR
jgi:holo-[acyl-carrier protein] synthase